MTRLLPVLSECCPSALARISVSHIRLTIGVRPSERQERATNHRLKGIRWLAVAETMEQNRCHRRTLVATGHSLHFIPLRLVRPVAACQGDSITTKRRTRLGNRLPWEVPICTLRRGHKRRLVLPQHQFLGI